MNSKFLSDKNIKQYFTSDAWTALSEYEKRRYENVQKNYEILKASGITPKMPEFMMSKFKRPMQNRNKASVGETKSSQEPKAKFKMFAVPKKDVSKSKNSNKGASSDISVVMEIESPSSKTVTTTMINLRGVKPKCFSQFLLNSAQSALKMLEDALRGMQEDFPFDDFEDINRGSEDIEEINLSEPGCSKDFEPKRRYPKRNIAKKCYKEEDVPNEDEYLFCEVCNEEYRGPCPVHGPMLQVCDTKVPKGAPCRARRTLPKFFSIGTSSIPRAGAGVWTEMPLVAGMVFGPYEGKVVRKKDYVDKSGYAWQVRKESKTLHYVEAEDEGRSNWMRYVNCADREEFQSVVAFQYVGQIYYRTCRNVLPFTEILVWYGNGYASELGIELKAKKCLQPPKEITGFPCDVCDRLFSSAESLAIHQKIHPRTQREGRHRCPECPYSSDHTGNLRDHLLTHSGERPHPCPHCTKRFVQESNLRKHLLVHTGLKEHTCTTCGKRFALKGDLTKHLLVHSGERPHRCPDCGRDFNRASSLKAHLRVHTRQRPYPCPHCEHRSTRSSALTRHIASLHTRVFPHNCPLCGKGFNTPGELKKHSEREHPETGH